MPKIAIIKNTGHFQTDQVFREVYGTATPEVIDGDGVSDRSMRIAPEFTPISLVFAGVAGKDFPVQPGGILEIDVPTDAMATIVKDQLMLSLKERWSRMYEQQAANLPAGLASMALQAEGAKVEAAIELHFASRGVRAWAVPVKGVMKTEADGAYVQSEQDLLSTLNPSIATSITLMSGDNQVILASDVATQAAAPTSLSQGAAAEEAQAPTWNEFDGIEADVEGHVIIMAASPEAARAATIVMQDLIAAHPQALGLSMVATRVVATRELRFEHPGEAGADTVDHEEDGTDGEGPEDDLGRDYTFQRG